MKVKTVFLLPNGNVAVFDDNGEQIAELQGLYQDVKERVLAASDEDTEFNSWPGRK